MEQTKASDGCWRTMLGGKETPTLFYKMILNVRICEGSEMLLCLPADKLPCHSVKDAGRDTRLLGQKHRTLLITAALVATVSIFFPLFL